MKIEKLLLDKEEEQLKDIAKIMRKIIDSVSTEEKLGLTA